MDSKRLVKQLIVKPFVANRACNCKLAVRAQVRVMVTVTLLRVHYSPLARYCEKKKNGKVRSGNSPTR